MTKKWDRFILLDTEGVGSFVYSRAMWRDISAIYNSNCTFTSIVNKILAKIQLFY